MTTEPLTPQTTEVFLSAVYDQLRRLAQQRLAAEWPGHTLQATALVHEAYLRLVSGGETHWDNPGHFFAAAAEAMRRILIEAARRKQRRRHGGGLQRIEMPAEVGGEMPVEEVLALDEALERFATIDARAATLVKLRCYAGLTVQQAARALEIPIRTAYRDWAFARAWMFRRTRGNDE